MIPNNKIKMFQNDLRNGMSIESALQKHGLTFKEVWAELHYRPRDPNRPVNKSTGCHYIGYQKGKYYIYHRQEYYGRYDDLDTAVRVRDYLVETGWDKKRLQNIRRTLGI